MGNMSEGALVVAAAKVTFARWESAEMVAVVRLVCFSSFRISCYMQLRSRVAVVRLVYIHALLRTEYFVACGSDSIQLMLTRQERLHTQSGDSEAGFGIATTLELEDPARSYPPEPDFEAR